MLRNLLALAVLMFFSAPAEAAQLLHPSATKNVVEKGVNVWRGPARKADAEIRPTTTAPACGTTKITVELAGWPPRRLRTHGFWSGRELTQYSFGVRTTGFYADRIAAGL